MDVTTKISSEFHLRYAEVELIVEMLSNVFQACKPRSVSVQMYFRPLLLPFSNWAR
jgi:hypothetical protein